MTRIARPKGLPECVEWRSYSGKVFNLLDPDPALICVEDIGHHLGRICRWNGGVPWFYSVAEHSLRCMSLVDFTVKLPTLLHDGHEMPLGDVSSPLKQILRCCTTTYDWLAQVWDDAIATAFNFDPSLFYDPRVRAADMALRALERVNLLCEKPTLEDCVAMHGLDGNEWQYGLHGFGLTRLSVDTGPYCGEMTLKFIEWCNGLQRNYHAKA